MRLKLGHVVLMVLLIVGLGVATIVGFTRPAKTVEVSREVTKEVEKVVKETVVVEKKVEKEVTKVVEQTVEVQTTPVPATPAPTSTPSATQVSNSPTSAPQQGVASSQLTMTSTSFVSNPCRDGEVIGNMYANLPRIPVGTVENNVVLEVSWPGHGFGGFDRAVVVVPQLLPDVQVFVNNASTIHMVRYCGSLAQVEAYVSDRTTHVNAMVVTAADGQGQVPKQSEIGVWSLDIPTGTLRSLVLAPDGPLTDTVRSHIEVVRLAITPFVPTVTPTRVATAAPTSALTATTTAARCVPSAIDGLGPWEPKDRTVVGPAVVNVGFPKEGNTQVRVFVPSRKKVTFMNAAGSGWNYASCTEAQAQAELVANAGNLKVVKVDDLIQAGKAKWQ